MQPSTLQEHLLNIFLNMGTTWVLYLLLALSIISLAVVMERLLHMRRYCPAGEALGLQRAIVQHFDDHTLDVLQKNLNSNQSYLSQIALVGLNTLPKGAKSVDQSMQANMIFMRMRMEAGMTFLGTLGNNAPFIGLFGTVLGIVRSFHDLSVHTTAGATVVMAGIAEALVTTAVGLFVALPAVAFFNMLQRRIRVQMDEAQAIVHMILTYAKSK